MNTRNQFVFRAISLSDKKQSHLKKVFNAITSPAHIALLAEQLYILNRKIKLSRTPRDIETLSRHINALNLNISLIVKLSHYIKQHQITFSLKKERMINHLMDTSHTLQQLKRVTMEDLEYNESLYSDSVSSARRSKKEKKPMLRWHTVSDVNTFFKDIKFLDEAKKQIEKSTIHTVNSIIRHDLLLPVIDKESHLFNEDKMTYYSHQYMHKSDFYNRSELLIFVAEFKDWCSKHVFILESLHVSLSLLDVLANIIFHYAQSHKLDGHTALTDAEKRIEPYLPLSAHCHPHLLHLSNVLKLMKHLDQYVQAAMEKFPNHAADDIKHGTTGHTHHKASVKKDWTKLRRFHRLWQTHGNLFSINWNPPKPPEPSTPKNK
jgi:hypothetical protein